MLLPLALVVITAPAPQPHPILVGTLDEVVMPQADSPVRFKLVGDATTYTLHYPCSCNGRYIDSDADFMDWYGETNGCKITVEFTKVGTVVKSAKFITPP